MPKFIPYNKTDKKGPRRMGTVNTSQQPLAKASAQTAGRHGTVGGNSVMLKSAAGGSRKHNSTPKKPRGKY